MAPFKDQLSPELARRLAAELHRAWPDFPSRRFTHGVAAELASRELLARADHLADRLGRTLPSGFGDAAGVVWRALASPTFTGWMTLPVGTFVARAGIDHPELALPLLAGLTPRWSSEAPIRAFIVRHPEPTYAHLHRWVHDDDEHVRRLVSEGTRPRLPWAMQLRALIADPGPNLPLLEALVDDPSAYVRRSVANHLNDLSKDHPDLALDLARSWAGRGARGAWVARHGLRTLVKRGDAGALALLGADTAAAITLTGLTVAPARLAIGEAATFSCTLLADAAVDAVVDYRVHYVGANGRRAPKVFKLTRRRLQPGVPATITRAHPFAHVSIRRIRSGTHTIDVQVNGRVLGSVDVAVVETGP